VPNSELHGDGVCRSTAVEFQFTDYHFNWTELAKGLQSEFKPYEVGTGINISPTILCLLN